MKLRLSPAAIDDLELIGNYTLRTWGEEQEARYLEGLWAKLEIIRFEPDLHRLRPELGNGCRSAQYGRHLIFFVVEETCVRVLRILHSAMDFGSHLSDGFS